MNRIVACHCPECKQYVQVPWTGQTDLMCPNCGHQLGAVSNPDDVFDRCPRCPCRQFYLSKNFNQFLGCLIMAVGIIFVPWTYGLSLPAVFLIDLALYRKVPHILNCYRCGCEFHGFEDQHHRFKPFLHHIGLKYDKYR
ncbi:MAG: hypothetical protein KC900_02690 [Candidatus Omnitrophica bacterium]|nr:hypothetical protein [Candidatus Omnitrophota bacterium]